MHEQPFWNICGTYRAGRAGLAMRLGEGRERHCTSQNPIATEVQHELLTLPYYEVFDNLSFHIKGSTVTILGQVTRASLKRSAEKTVKQIEGVQSVDNPIEVLPASPGDSRIRLSVFGATYGQLLLNQFEVQSVPPVHIIVKNGNVTLEGAVDNQSDKTAFFTAASGVPGVVSVTDHLKIAPGMPA